MVLQAPIHGTLRPTLLPIQPLTSPPSPSLLTAFSQRQPPGNRIPTSTSSPTASAPISMSTISPLLQPLLSTLLLLPSLPSPLYPFLSCFPLLLLLLLLPPLPLPPRLPPPIPLHPVLKPDSPLPSNVSSLFPAVLSRPAGATAEL
ncbi:hypothetical protein MMC13_004216 [Lambiella insularis]|nr:hypothetical protein [Lambiella insularis]